MLLSSEPLLEAKGELTVRNVSNPIEPEGALQPQDAQQDVITTDAQLAAELDESVAADSTGELHPEELQAEDLTPGGEALADAIVEAAIQPVAAHAMHESESQPPIDDEPADVENNVIDEAHATDELRVAPPPSTDLSEENMDDEIIEPELDAGELPEDVWQPIPLEDPEPGQITRLLYRFDGKHGLGRRAVEESSPDEAPALKLCNLAFCSEVKSYGIMTKYDADAFVASQQVLLYAELENFQSEPSPRGYHTALRSGYEILDSHGRRVARCDFPLTEETCQNKRRDFFVRYFLTLPPRIPPGNYTLHLHMTDEHGGTSGEGSLDFSIRAKPGS